MLVLPVFRRHWLFHAWQTERQALKSQVALKDWRKGQGLEERISLWSQGVSHKASCDPASAACLITPCMCFAVLLAMQAGNTTAQSLQAWQKVLAQWESLENAKERTFKYWLYR